MVAPLLSGTPGQRPGSSARLAKLRYNQQNSMEVFARSLRFPARQHAFRIFGARWIDVIENREKIHVHPSFGPLENKRDRTPGLMLGIIVDDRLDDPNHVRPRLDGV